MLLGYRNLISELIKNVMVQFLFFLIVIFEYLYLIIWSFNASVYFLLKYIVVSLFFLENSKHIENK